MAHHKNLSVLAILALVVYAVLTPFQAGQAANQMKSLDLESEQLVDYLVINEFSINHVGTDTEEFVEVYGAASTDYSTYTILEIEGDSGGSMGYVDEIIPIGTTDANGFWFIDLPDNAFENGTVTLLLVSDFTGSLNMDLDTDKNGILDVTPWSALVDSVGVHDGGVDDRVYSETVLTSNFDGVDFLPGGASRIPNGVDTDTIADWMRNDFDLAGIPGFAVTPVIGEALNTPGKTNIAIPLLNEFVYDHAGQDTLEFFEIYGSPNSDFSSLKIIVIESDSGGQQGTIENVIGVGYTDTNGYYYIMMPTNAIGDNSVTFLLVYEFTGNAGQDLDPNDDGILDSKPWTALIDSIGVTDGGTADYVYSDIVLSSGYDGISGAPGGASRIPNAIDTSTVADWMRNDFDMSGYPGYPISLAIGEAANTPGAENWGALVSNDLSITKSGPDFVHPGEQLTYQISVVNYSLVRAVNVKITDTLPLDTTYVSDTSGNVPFSPQPGVYEWVLGDLPAGSAFNFDLTVQLSAETELGWLINEIEVDSDLTPDDPTNNSNIWKTIVPQPLTIHEIQGASHLSPKEDYLATEIPGVVTWVTSRSFYLQTPDEAVDADEATSEGILVYVGSTPAVAVGDLISMTATVDEYYPGGFASGNLSTTELINPKISIISSGNPLPSATVVGMGGRMPPTEVISNDSTGNVEGSLFDPAEDGIDFYESLEGMLVSVEDALVVGPTNPYGEIPVVPNAGAWATGLTQRDGVVIQADDFNPERIIIDDALYASEPKVDVGTTFDDTVTGLLDYNFGNFKLQNTAALPTTTGELAKETTSLVRVADQITVATFNVENLDPNPLDGDDDTPRFTALATQIVTHLDAPDIIVLQEIQDNTGATDDGVTAADLTYQTLIDAITTAGGPLYTFVDIAPEDNMDGGAPGGNIRVGFLYRVDRGLSFVSRAGGDAITATTVAMGLTGAELSYSPGRIDPTNTAWFESRKPLVAEFLFNQRKLFVVGNHFNSKSGDSYLFGRIQPPQLISEVQRIQQAQVVNDFVDSILTLDPTALIAVAGDLNDFQFSNPLLALEGGVLTNLHNTNPIEDRYTYVYDGNSQALDHILVSSKLLAADAIMDVVHVNAEYDYLERISDHDPVLARFTLPLVEVAFPEATFTVSESAGFANLTVVLEATSVVTVSVEYKTTALTAIPDVDYVPLKGAVDIAPGQTTATISIPIIDNLVRDELYKTFLVTLANPIEAILGLQYEITVIIVDDETPLIVYLPIVVKE